MKNILISICITSYNRPKELRRCLDSIDATDRDLIEIVISEDLSPKRELIKKEIEDYKRKSKYKVVSNFNNHNLGYDRNLEKLISISNGKYILFCSDDDKFIANQLDVVIDYLKKSANIAYMYTAYKSKDKKSANRNYKNDFTILKGEKSVEKYMYDSVLFSGLIFEKEKISCFSASNFVNLNYFQIYLAMKMLYHYGAIYKSITLIDCIADGENGYGTTELSSKDILLADRKNIYSNLQFNKGLVKVIKIFDSEENTKLLKNFSIEYSIRSYRGMSRARSYGKKELKNYWNFLNNIGVEINIIAKIYFILLFLLGNKICDKLFDIPRKILFKVRKYD